MNPTAFADAIAAQWDDLYGPSRYEVPMSVLATAVMRQHLVTPAPESTAPRGFLSGQQRVWDAATQRWPYLHHRWAPFVEWPTWPDYDRATHAAMAFALRLRTLGVIEHLRTLTHHQDFLGGVLHRLRALMAPGAVDPLDSRPPQRLRHYEPGQVITLDGVGSGHRILGVLGAMRAQGVDPQAMNWRMREIDELAATTLCVNLMAWQVADPDRPNVLVSISEDDWIRAEQEERAEALHALLGPTFGL